MLDSQSENNECESHSWEGWINNVGVDETHSWIILVLPTMSKIVAMLTSKIPP